MSHFTEPQEQEIAYVDARAEAETEKALFCVLKTGEKIWVPKSLIQTDSEVKVHGDEGELAVPLWFCEKKGVL